ncbi:MAG: hypothetical protein BWY95_00554 [Bacteroidetes bacterium ADurb.BinA104]|nr:MAG: hypothetical protein BWY95_00554 [Bacteroidetes bacterium ADurb.BinA104]
MTVIQITVQRDTQIIIAVFKAQSLACTGGIALTKLSVATHNLCPTLLMSVVTRCICRYRVAVIRECVVIHKTSVTIPVGKETIHIFRSAFGTAVGQQVRLVLNLAQGVAYACIDIETTHSYRVVLLVSQTQTVVEGRFQTGVTA